MFIYTITFAKKKKKKKNEVDIMNLALPKFSHQGRLPPLHGTVYAQIISLVNIGNCW